MLKIKNYGWHRQPVDKKFAVAFLSVFAILVGVYTLAVYRSFCLKSPADIKSPAASVVQLPPDAAESEKVSFRPFASADEFKSYIDDGRRAYGDGVFESENLKLETDRQALAVSSVGKSAKLQSKAPAKNPVAEPVSAEDALKYLSLGANQEGGSPDIMQADFDKIFFSPESKSYRPAMSGFLAGSKMIGAISENIGQSLVVSARPAESMALAGTVAAGGDLLLADDKILVFRNNLLTAYGIDGAANSGGNGATTSTELWQARINEGSRVLASRVISPKLYLVIETGIAGANPCPIKPLLLGENPVIINCKDIYRPGSSIKADAIYSILELNLSSGQVSKDISFVGDSENSTAIISNDSIYAMWGQGGDYIAFFTGFLKDECVGLLPNYLLEKAAELPLYDISLAAKELELRALISNWINSLSASEQARITGEVAARMDDYLRDHYRDFEQTGVAKIDLVSFNIAAEKNIPGRIIDGSSASADGGMLRVATVSGRGAARKMAWLVTGKIAENPGKTVNNIYILDKQLLPAGFREDLDLGAGICAINYSGNKAFASDCGDDGVFHMIGLDSLEEVGLAGELKPSESPSYLYSISDGLTLAVSKNDRKIKVSLYDVSLAAKPEMRSDYDLNDYWTDFDSNYQAFAADKQDKLLFLPTGKGGYLLSYRGGRIEFKKAVGGLTVARARFLGGSLYLAGDFGIEVFGGPDWGKIKSIIF